MLGSSLLIWDQPEGPLSKWDWNRVVGTEEEKEQQALAQVRKDEAKYKIAALQKACVASLVPQTERGSPDDAQRHARLPPVPAGEPPRPPVLDEASQILEMRPEEGNRCPRLPPVPLGDPPRPPGSEPFPFDMDAEEEIGQGQSAAESVACAVLRDEDEEELVDGLSAQLEAHEGQNAAESVVCAVLRDEDDDEEIVLSAPLEKGALPPTEALVKALSGTWRGRKNEYYTISEGPDPTQWSCVKQDGSGSKRFALTLDPENFCVWWGLVKSVFVDINELLENPEVLHWTPQDPNNRKLRFSWDRVHEGPPRGGLSPSAAVWQPVQLPPQSQ